MTKAHTKRLAEANLEAREAARGRGGIDKRVTTFKAAVSKDADASTGAVDFAPMEPTPEQLDKINRFTRSPKTASDLVVFPTLSANDLWDRDEERFTTATVKEFASLPEPLSSVGKSYMVGHDYTKLPVGRIFDVGTKTLTVDDEGTKATFLKHDVYVPKTEANQGFIEGIDFGINWAVSVGVMLESAKCSISWCQADMFTSRLFGAWCSEGHDKGLFYTEDAEKDSWGYYVPCDPKTSGAEKCRTNLIGAKDFYELSQVFLGAQYFAALEQGKAATARNIIKAASARSVPIVGMSADEATAVLSGAIPSMDARALHAVRHFGARFDEDDTLRWTDDNSLVWTYDAKTSEVMCLGKSQGEEEADAQPATGEPAADSHSVGSTEQQPDSGEPAAVEREGDDTADGGLGSDEVTEGVRQDGTVKQAGHSHVHRHSNGTSHNHNHTHNGDNAYQHSTSDNVSHEHSHGNKDAVVAACRGLSVPEVLVQSVLEVQSDDLTFLLAPVAAELAKLAPRAELGGRYVESKRAEAIDWYVKANQTEPNQPISTDLFERLLGAAGDNIELLDELAKQQKTLAQAKFPAAARRSSIPVDANVPAGITSPPIPDDDQTKASESATGRTVKRIHG